MMEVTTNTTHQLTDSMTNTNDTTLSPMKKCFLVVLVFAMIDALLGAIYTMIWYHSKKKKALRNHTESRHAVPRVHRAPVCNHNNSQQKKRRTSTHIAIAMAQNKESVRRVASAYL